MEGVKEGLGVEGSNLQEENSSLRAELDSLKQELREIRSLLSSQIPADSQTDHNSLPTDSPSEASSFPLFSIGNEGVPTNRQTGIRQTLQPALDAVSSLRSELKIKFRSLTKQEFKVFAAVYILEEQQQPAEYKLLAEKLRLSEGSIRDYIMKMERKGIPIRKEKVNNKKVLLHVKQELRDLVTLDAIMQIREPIFR